MWAHVLDLPAPDGFWGMVVPDHKILTRADGKRAPRFAAAFPSSKGRSFRVVPCPCSRVDMRTQGLCAGDMVGIDGP